MSGSVERAQLTRTRPVGEGCSARGDARARIPEGSSATRRRSPRRRSLTGPVEGLPVATFPAARALKSRPTSCLAADVVGSVGRARLVIPLGLDYKGVSGPELNCCIAVWYGNAATALFFCFRGLCEIGRDKRSRRARSEPIVTRLGQLRAHLARGKALIFTDTTPGLATNTHHRSPIRAALPYSPRHSPLDRARGRPLHARPTLRALITRRAK